MADFVRLWDDAVRASRQRAKIYGVLGRPDGVVPVSERVGYVYVRTGLDGNQTVVIAFNEGAPILSGLPVYMERENGRLVVKGINITLANEFLSGITNVAKHTHRTGSGMEYVVQALWLEPGRIAPSSTMTVTIAAFWYEYGGDRKYWPGGTIDLTSYQPATISTWAWVLVGVDPATNTAVAVAGTAKSTALGLEESELADIAFADYIPCGAIKVKESDTALNDIRHFFDAHIWFAPDGGVEALDDLSDATITSPATGSVLRYDGTNWVNTDDVVIDVSGVKLHVVEDDNRAILRISQTRSTDMVAGTVVGELQFDGDDPDALASTVDAMGVIRTISQAGSLATGNKQSDMAFLVKGASGNHDETALEVMRLTYEGNLGVRTASPQGLIHGHDGSGGFLHWTGTLADGTAQTVIPDGAGDATVGVAVLAYVKASGLTNLVGPAADVDNGSSVNIFDDSGGNTVALAVAADGSVTVQRTGGTATHNISMWLTWL